MLFVYVIVIVVDFFIGVANIPYSGKLWRALNLANQSPERIGEF